MEKMVAQGRLKSELRRKGIPLLCVWVFAYLFLYIGFPIQGTVIDSESGIPVQDVIVVANWQLHINAIFADGPGRQLLMLETVTDEQGHFRFPFWVRLALAGSLRRSAPKLQFYKKDYHVQSRSNSYSKSDPIILVISIVDGETIKLSPFKRPLQEYAKHIESTILSKLTGIGIRPQDCSLNNTPKIIAALVAENERFKESNLTGLNLSVLTTRSKVYCQSTEPKQGT